MTMRQKIVDTLLQIVDKDTYFLTADVGFGVLEPLKEKMGDNFINVGLAEQSMIGIASGLALSGKKVYTYTMCSFYLRALEQIKLDLCYQNVPVTMLAIGTQFDYSNLGTTHFAFDDDKVIKQLLNIDVFTPKDQKQLDMILRLPVTRPLYLRAGGYEENLDVELDWDKLKEYPKEGGSRQYFINKFGKK
jgi:transketolase